MRRLFAAWHRTERGLAIAAWAAMALVLTLDVIGRELLFPLQRALGLPYGGGGGIFGASKIALYCLVVGTYAGIGVAAATASHVVPRVGRFVTPPAWSAALDRWADVLTAALLAGAAYAGALLVHGSWSLGTRAPLLQWPLWAVQLAMPLGLLSAALRYAGFAAWPDLRPPPRGPGE